MARALVRAGHEVHVLTDPFPDLEERGPAVLPGVRWHTVDVNSGKSALPGAYYSQNARYAMAVLEALRPLHARHRFEYIEFLDYRAPGYWCLRAKRLLGDFENAVLGVRLH